MNCQTHSIGFPCLLETISHGEISDDFLFYCVKYLPLTLSFSGDYGIHIVSTCWLRPIQEEKVFHTRGNTRKHVCSFGVQQQALYLWFQLILFFVCKMYRVKLWGSIKLEPQPISEVFPVIGTKYSLAPIFWWKKGTRRNHIVWDWKFIDSVCCFIPNENCRGRNSWISFSKIVDMWLFSLSSSEDADRFGLRHLSDINPLLSVFASSRFFKGLIV